MPKATSLVDHWYNMLIQKDVHPETAWSWRSIEPQPLPTRHLDHLGLKHHLRRPASAIRQAQQWWPGPNEKIWGWPSLVWLVDISKVVGEHNGIGDFGTSPFSQQECLDFEFAVIVGVLDGICLELSLHRQQKKTAEAPHFNFGRLIRSWQSNISLWGTVGAGAVRKWHVLQPWKCTWKLARWFQSFHLSGLIFLARLKPKHNGKWKTMENNGKHIKIIQNHGKIPRRPTISHGTCDL